MLLPRQSSPTDTLALEETTIKPGDGSLAERVSKRLTADGLLITTLGPSTLLHELNRIPLWRGDHVEIRQLADDFARYPYLSRVAGPAVVHAAAADGPASMSWQTDTFAYAEGYDEANGRYINLVGGHGVLRPAVDTGALVVKADVAARQLTAERGDGDGEPGGDGSSDFTDDDDRSGVDPTAEAHRKLRYLASAALDPLTPARSFSKINDEILRHLGTGKLRLRLEIESEDITLTDAQRRTLTENTRALGLDGGISES